MACKEEQRELLVRLSLGRLEGAEADAVLEHALTCADCSEDLELLADLTRASEAGTQAGSKDGAMATATEPTSGEVDGQVGSEADVVRAPALTRRQSRFRWLQAAAALLVVAAIAWSLAPGPVRDYTAVADLTPFPFVEGTLRGNGADDPRSAQLQEAMATYKRGDYEAAGSALRSLVDGDADLRWPRVYLGVCELQRGDPDGAIEALLPALESVDVAEHALWFVGMAQLVKNDGAEARRTFERLRDRKSRLEHMAADVLSQLDDIEER